MQVKALIALAEDIKKSNPDLFDWDIRIEPQGYTGEFRIVAHKGAATHHIGMTTILTR